jgi:hypothetical protein
MNEVNDEDDELFSFLFYRNSVAESSLSFCDLR